MTDQKINRSGRGIAEKAIDHGDGTFGIAVATFDDQYETVAASATDQIIGGTGALGDYLAAVNIFPATTSPGAVLLKDGAGAAYPIFPGGANSVPSLIPFSVPFGIRSKTGPWSITTGAGVSVMAIGRFT